jgi:hypothetical protein
LEQQTHLFVHFGCNSPWVIHLPITTCVAYNMCTLCPCLKQQLAVWREPHCAERATLKLCLSFCKSPFLGTYYLSPPRHVTIYQDPLPLSLLVWHKLGCSHCMFWVSVPWISKYLSALSSIFIVLTNIISKWFYGQV